MTLQAPFPWFGGKSRAASEVWQRFGDAPNYVEPFFGSGAVLLGRPHPPGIETANDKDGFVSNFWRALQHDPEATADHADWPVNENDLHARHVWLKERRSTLAARLEGDPDYFDAKIAGWWVWGMACWIGGGFCGDSGSGPWDVANGQLVHLGDAGQGVSRRRVHLGNAGQGVSRRRGLLDWFEALSERLRFVRVCCGDWLRILGPSPTVKQGITGVFLDPPYSEEAEREAALYSEDDLAVAHAVRDWAVANGDNPELRIALCGYEGEHQMPPSWAVHEWSTSGGYAKLGSGRGMENRHRERIWFSSACLRERQPSLWAEGAT